MRAIIGGLKDRSPVMCMGFVRKDFNGRGLGSFMLDWCANKVSCLNRRFVRLDCAVQHTKLCAYYESLGFIRVGQYAEPESGGHIWSLYEKLAY